MRIDGNQTRQTKQLKRIVKPLQETVHPVPMLWIWPIGVQHALAIELMMIRRRNPILPIRCDGLPQFLQPVCILFEEDVAPIVRVK